MRAERERAGDESGDADGQEATLEALGRRAAVAVVVTVLGVVASVLGSVPGLVVGRSTAAGYTLALVGSELGFVAAGVLFLVWTGRGVGYLDMELPGGHRRWALVAGATVGLFAFRSVLILAAAQVGITPAGSSVTQVDLPFEVLVAILLPAMLLVVGPAEELLFRGVLQKYLREAVSAPAAIIGAGTLFGTIHLPTLVAGTGLGVFVSLGIITLVGFGLGWLYEYTGSLPAAMLGHGAYNALIVATAYAFEVAA
jgi:membrane protease YdiL (CAAX protease family)